MKFFKGTLVCGTPIEVAFPDNHCLQIETGADKTVRVLVSNGSGGLDPFLTTRELLEALQTIKRRMYEPRALMIKEVEGIIDTAIAKATGQ